MELYTISKVYDSAAPPPQLPSSLQKDALATSQIALALVEGD